MRKAVFVLTTIAIAASLTAGLMNCGGTGGDGSGTGAQFINTSCNPDSDCLSVTVTSPQTQGQSSLVRARLLDASGAPIADVLICFELEGGATFEETDGDCALTDDGGNVSVRMTPTNPGSLRFTVTAPGGLENVSTIIVRPAPTPAATATPTATPTPDPNACTTDADCTDTGQFCNNPDDECGLSPVGQCDFPRPNGDCCVRDSQCTSGFCDPNPPQTCQSGPATPTPTPAP